MNETQCRSRLLQLACLLSGGTAFLSLLIAVTSDHWLQAADPVPVPSLTDMNLAEEVETKPADDAYDRVKMRYVVINTFSGLWRVCIMLPAEDMVARPSCQAIDYDSLFSNRVSGGETTMSIVRAIRAASFSVVFSLVSLIAGLACAAYGRFSRNYFSLVGSVILVVTGLVLTLGLVLYVRAVSDEVGYRKPPKNDMPVFKYAYSWSFWFAAVALVSTNVVAVANVYLYQGGYLDVIAPVTSPVTGSAGSDVSYEGPIVIVH